RPAEAVTLPSERAARRIAYLAVAILAVWVWLLLRWLAPGGGLLGRYAIHLEGGAEIPVHERIDPDLDFPVPQRIDAAYIYHWDLSRFGIPVTMPPMVVRWSGLLQVPEEGRYGFAIEATGETTLLIDGVAVPLATDALAELTLRAGLHPLEVDYRLSQGEAKLILRWRPPGGDLRPIPASHLAVDRAAIESDRRRHAAGWSLLAGGILAALGLVLAGRRAGGPAARLVERLAAERPRLALGAILILAALLRFDDYALVPFHHETADEYQHAWEGWNLLHHTQPAAWSTFPDRYPVLQTRDFRWFGDRYVLVWPYFDHPPLFSILVGLVNSLAAASSPPLPAGAPDYLWCSLPVMRLVPIVLSLLGTILLVRLARAYGASERAALLAALVYATLPLIVLSHRLVKAESLLALLFMGAILLARRHERTQAPRDAALAGILCGLSLWTKATGVAVPATVLVLMLRARRARGAALAMLVTAGFLALYLVYAWALDFNIFLKVIEAQSTTKWVSLDALQDLLGGKVVVKWFGRGWYLWLLLAAGVAALKQARSLLVPLAIYGVLIALTADQRVIYGWYRIPIYPFLCVAAGLYLEEMIREADLYTVFPFAVTAVATGLLYALPAGLAQTQAAVACFALCALAPFLLHLALERRATLWLARAATWALVGIFLLTNLTTIRGMLEIYAATRGVR
ncbi:MAG TPA: glycosyltransferase family 39 protein, partial [Candidatus Polarisedimenticolia bacterium]|nr:glycosyltransferase family 39 protein [Candidatus Polarisedimenticolia bacterium]